VSAQQLIKQGEQLFGKRGQLLSLWQRIAENFYPERADFTVTRNIGFEFGDWLNSSYPLLARRDLGNAFGTMLRPTSKNWFHIRTKDKWEELGSEARAWLEMAENRQRRAMFAGGTQFSRATKEGDHDFAAFGQTVIQTSLNSHGNGLLYRCWHLRDVAWMEDENGNIGTVYRKWKPTVADVMRLFPRTVHENVAKRMEKEPYGEVEVWHCLVPTDGYNADGKTFRTPFISIYLDVSNKHKMEEIGVFGTGYVIPRWQTVSGSQYAYSPATVVAMPDARLIQAMTGVLLEAGEKAVSPPMIAVQGALRSDLNILPGGVTWVDTEYDERLGEVLRPLTQDKSGIPLGLEMAQDTRQMIAEAFYLNKISLPAPDNTMTAYEVGQRVQEYIRQAMPLFEPMEPQYNGPLCENTFELLLRAGVFGSPMDMPEELRGADIQFTFESPLHDAVEREKGQRLLEAGSLIAQVTPLDQTVAYLLDAKVAIRDTMQGTGVPQKWIRSESQVEDLARDAQQKQQAAELLAQMQSGATVAKTLSDANAPTGGGQPGLGLGIAAP
jgi:hypothetical protein